jgi:protein-tyrosine phosphatase
VSEIFWITGFTQGRLGTMAHPEGGDRLDSEVADWKQAGVSVVATALTDDEMCELKLLEEGEICGRHGIELVRFPVPDRSRPSSLIEWSEFIKRLSQAVADQKSLVAHCRMGIGRSSMIAVSVMIAQGLTVNRALELMIIARRRPIPDTAEQLEWIAEYAKSVGRGI